MSRSYVSVPIDRRRCARMRMRQQRRPDRSPRIVNTQQRASDVGRRIWTSFVKAATCMVDENSVPPPRPSGAGSSGEAVAGRVGRVACARRRQDGCICAVRPATVAFPRSNLLRRLQAVGRTTDCLVSCRPESSSVSRSPRARQFNCCDAPCGWLWHEPCWLLHTGTLLPSTSSLLPAGRGAGWTL
jgi:hypothetical protein